ncbi:MAG: hypothetical protein JO115_12760 [Pseudonocardiales bacterium]|nr:hypothetical protein [Pseudonocardiales bacterium]
MGMNSFGGGRFAHPLIVSFDPGVQPQRVGGHTMALGCPVTSQGECEHRRDGLC